jgi:hypothetical protein
MCCFVTVWACGASTSRRCCDARRRSELKRARSRLTGGRLARTRLPAIAAVSDGGFLLLGRAEGDEVLVSASLGPPPAQTNAC